MNVEVAHVSENFKHGQIGWNIKSFESIDSTNAYALKLPDEEFQHGMIVVARSQTLGRGRQGRNWLSIPDKGLYFTALLESQRPAREAPVLSLVAAIALYETLSKYCQKDLDIKWPNDILLEGKKVCGILGELKINPKGRQKIALGISVNISHGKEDFPSDFRDRATSLLLSEGSNQRLETILQTVLERLNHWYSFFSNGNTEKIIDAISSASSYVSGKRIKVLTEPDTQVSGTTSGLNPDGSLQLRLDQGVEITLHAGEVHLL